MPDVAVPVQVQATAVVAHVVEAYILEVILEAIQVVTPVAVMVAVTEVAGNITTYK